MVQRGAARRNDMNTLFAQIEASSKIDNLDDAVRPIQETLGQTDGGNAAQFFEDVDGSWAYLTEDYRRYQLIRYAVYELGMLEMAR
jgi:hypothetical protein